MIPANVALINHPLVQHKLTIMRRKDTSTKNFRQLLREIALLIGYEATRDLELANVEIETPLQTMQSPTIAGKKLVFAPILRAGMGLLEGMLDLVPSARVAHIGLYRDPATLEPVEYYFKAPEDLCDRLTIVLDPMLATANSAVAAVQRLKDRGAENLRLVCLLPHQKGSTASAWPIPMCESIVPRSMNGSTIMAISCLASEMPAIASTEPNSRVLLLCR